MAIPYRARQGLRKFFAGLLILVLLSILLLVCWFLWLNRYVVYSQDGAKLDFDLSLNYGEGEAPVKPTLGAIPEIHDKTEDGDNATGTQFLQFSGYYVTMEELTESFEETAQKLRKLPKGSTILLELKNVQGACCYSTAVASATAKETDSFSLTMVDELIAELQGKGHYLIAQIPAFQERAYILENERERVPYGLPKAGGNGSLWPDYSGKLSCYWLNPLSDGTMTYLFQLVTEIRNLGFDELVLSDFRFPETDQIVFEGDKMQALVDTAATLVKTCSTDGFAVSFARGNTELSLPEGRTRLYMVGVSAADAAAMAEMSTLSDTAVQLVFLTDSHDPRYDDYSTLRPLDSVE